MNVTSNGMAICIDFERDEGGIESLTLKEAIQLRDLLAIVIPQAVAATRADLKAQLDSLPKDGRRGRDHGPRRTGSTDRIVSILRASGKPMRLTEIVDRADVYIGSAINLMKQCPLIVRLGRGLYDLRERHPEMNGSAEEVNP